MPFGKQEGGERTDGKGSEVKFVRLDENYNHRLHRLAQIIVTIPST